MCERFQIRADEEPVEIQTEMGSKHVVGHKYHEQASIL